MENAEPSSQTASSSYKDGISLSRTIEAKRRRLEDLSFSSPGPAFTSSSDVGDEESDADGATRRRARIRARKQQPSTILSTNASHQTNKEASQPLSDPVRSSPLFRNFSNSVFRKLDKTAAINGKQHKVPRHDTLPSPRFPNGEPHHSSEPSEIGVVPGPSTLRKSSKSSPPDRSKMTPPFGARLNGASPSSAPRPVHTSPGLAKASSPTKRERLITQKKQELDRVYKDHDSLVRELFHLTKFVTYFGFDPDLAAQDQSDVFERFRMDYDLPTRLSGASGRATRRIVSAKRSDLDLKKEAEKKRLISLTKVDTNGHVPANHSKIAKGKEKGKEKGKGEAEEKVEVVKRGRGRPRKVPLVVVESSESSDSADNERSITVSAKRGRKKARARATCSQSSSSSSEAEHLPAKKRAVKPTKRIVGPDYEPRPPVILERVEGIPRSRYMQPSQLPPRPRHGGSLIKYLQSWHTTGELLHGGTGDMEVTSLSALHERERRDAMLYSAIQEAKQQGMLLDDDEAALRHQQARIAEAPRRETDWDSLLHAMIALSASKRTEARNKVAVCKRISRMIHLYWDEKLGRGERQQKVEERRIRALAKFTVREIRKQWKLAVNVIKARRLIVDKEQRDRAGREQLKSILEQSTQMLGMQHRVLVKGETGIVSESESEDESDDSDDETEESEVDSLTDKEGAGTEVEEEEIETGSVVLAGFDHCESESKDKTTDSDEEMAEKTEPLIKSNGRSDDEDVEGMANVKEMQADADDVVAKIRPPFLLRGNLRPYQQIGFEWLASLYKNGSNGILADEMGLGKTIQTISVLAHLACDKGEWGPHLVVAPTSVMLNWEVEFKKFLPGFKILSYYGSQKERKEKRRGWNSDNHFNVCITSYQLVLADQHILRRKAWNYLILDEAHHIKNFKSQRWQTLLGFHSNRRLLLTGTPLQNNLMDLWSLMYFLMPNGVTSADGVVSSGFASMKEFQQWFSNPLGKAVESAGIEGDDGEVDDETRGMVSKLHTLLRPYLLRRLKADVEKELPNKYEHVIRCRLSKRQKFLYNDFMSRAKTRESLASGNYLSIINCLMQLRKVCNHPDLFEQRPIVTSFASARSVVADYEIKELLVRKELLHQHDENQVNLKTLNLIFTSTEEQHLTPIITRSLGHLDASDRLPHGTGTDAGPVEIDTWTVEGYKRSMARHKKVERMAHWKHAAYVNRLRCQVSPPSMCNGGSVEAVQSMFKASLRGLAPFSVAVKDTRGFMQRCDNIHQAVLSNDERREMMQDVIDRFAFVTPRAVTNDIAKWALPGFNYETMPKEMLSPSFDTLHQPAVKLQIAFPDASLLQYDCGKLQELALLMQRCKTGGHRILIFTQMTKILDILETWLSLNGFKYLRLDGSTKVEDRQALTERFNRDDRIKAFILSTRSGGLGINLTGADMVLFWDLDWNFQIEAQCMDRAHRIGQTRDVHIYRFVSEHTIEENMLKKSNEKRMLDNMVIQNGQFTTEGLSKMSWIESMFDEGGKTIAGVQIGTQSQDETPVASDRRIETAMNQAEDEEDARAAKQAQMELNLLDNDFEMEMSQDKQKQQQQQQLQSQVVEEAGPGDIVDQVQELDEEPAEEDEDAGTIDEYMLKRVDAEWDYFASL